MADSVYRVTEVVGVSSESWEAAARVAVETAGKSVRDAASRGIDAASGLAEDLREAAREKVDPIRRAINRG